MLYAWTGIYMLGTKTYRTAEMVRGTEKEGDLSHTEVNMLKVISTCGKACTLGAKTDTLGKVSSVRATEFKFIIHFC